MLHHSSSVFYNFLIFSCQGQWCSRLILCILLLFANLSWLKQNFMNLRCMYLKRIASVTSESKTISVYSDSIFYVMVYL